MKKYLLIFKHPNNTFSSKQYEYYFECVKRKNKWKDLASELGIQIYIAIIDIGDKND